MDSATRLQGAEALRSALRGDSPAWLKRAPEFILGMLATDPQLANPKVFWKGPTGEVLCELPGLVFHLDEAAVSLDVGIETHMDGEEAEIEAGDASAGSGDAILNVSGTVTFYQASLRNAEEGNSWELAYTARVFGVPYNESISGSSLREVLMEMAAQSPHLHSALCSDPGYGLLAGLCGVEIDEPMDYSLPATAEAMLTAVMSLGAAQDEDDLEDEDDGEDDDLLEGLRESPAAPVVLDEGGIGHAVAFDPEEARRTELALAKVAQGGEVAAGLVPDVTEAGAASTEFSIVPDAAQDLINRTVTIAPQGDVIVTYAAEGQTSSQTPSVDPQSSGE